MFEVFVIKLLVAILDRLMFPNLIDTERDRKHQWLMQHASDYAKAAEKKG